MGSTFNSASRHRSNIATIFDVFCEIAWPEMIGQALSDSPVIITKYPEDFNDKVILRSLCQFAFPSGNIKPEVEERYSFVLTDENGRFTFGYCYYNPQNVTSLCLLSGMKWDKAFFSILDSLSSAINVGTATEIDDLLTSIYHTDIPQAGDIADFRYGTHRLRFAVPDQHRLPGKETEKYLHNFFDCIPYKHIIHIYASILKERRIIFTCERISKLSNCVQAAAKMIFPMIWQSIFVPVLPEKLFEMLMAPMPFLVGVPKNVFSQATLKNFGDLVIVDMDERTFKSSNNDIDSLPSEVYAFLKQSLKSTEDQDHFKTFLRANVMLFGSYRNGFKRNEETKEISWSKRRFLSSITKPVYHSYLSSLLGKDGSQYLERFLEDRIKSLSFGIPESDEFEREISLYEKKEKSIKKENEPMEILGSLIDKVAVNLSEKFAKLDIKKPFGSLKKRDSHNTLLSFDNEQFEHPSEGENISPPKIEVKASSPPVANLIDLRSPVKNMELVPIDASKMALIPISPPNGDRSLCNDNYSKCLVPSRIENKHCF